MKALEIIHRARYDLNDTQAVAYTDQKLLLYINDGIEHINNLLVTRHSSYITETATFVHSPSRLPPDFLAMYRNYPENIRIDGDWLYFRPIEPITIRYFKKLKRVEDLSENLPLGTEFYPLLTQYVVMRAANSNEYSSVFEQQLIQTLENELIKLIRLRDGTHHGYGRAQKYYL